MEEERAMAIPPSGNRNDQPNSLFTLDNSGGDPVEMPSVTKLLNRKKLGLVQTSETKNVNKSKPSLAKPSIPGQPHVQRVQPRKTRSKAPKIAHWTQETLATTDDTFQKAVHYLIQKGARQVLLLTPPAPVTHLQMDVHFDALCASMTEDKVELWNGLTLAPSLIPDVWRCLFTQGLYEIVPSVSLNTQDESAAFIIKAFGLKPTEFFVIVRCGAPNACTGLLALVSGFSLTKEIGAAFSAPKIVDQAA
jgi:hypothetical protein